MKKILYLLCLVVFASGCSLPRKSVGVDTTPTNSSIESTVDITEKDSISVAYMEEDLASTAIIESFYSETVELIPVVLSEDAFDNYLLYTNDPADIVLIPHSTQVYTAAYALQNCVHKLDEILPKITEGTEYYPVLDAGKIDGSQYFLPLRFHLPYLLTTELNLEIFGLSALEQSDMKTWMVQIQAASEKENAEKGMLFTPMESNIGTALYNALRLSGAWVADPASPGAPVTEELLYEYGQYIKTLWKETEHTKAQRLRTHSIYPYPLVSSESIPFVFGEGCLPDIFRVFAEGNSSQPVLLGHPQYSSANAITADITLYAAIQTKRDNYTQIQEFLRHAFTTPEGQGTQEGLSVCCAAVATYMDHLASQTATAFSDGPYYRTVQGLSEPVRSACELVLDQVVSGSIRSAYWDRLFSNEMEAFSSGEKSYEECIQSLSSRLCRFAGGFDITSENISFPHIIMEEIDLELAHSFYDDKYPLFPSVWYDEAEDNGLEIKVPCGNFHGCVVFLHMRDGILPASVIQKIGDSRLEYNANHSLYAYRNGVFFDLVDAYNRGYLTQNNIELVAQCLADYAKIGMS